MKLIYTHQSIFDLERLRQFIAVNNPDAASNIAKKLITAITRLIEFPHLGKVVDTTEGDKPLRDLITSSYVIRYIVLNEEIHILKIWHGKENLK